MYIGEKKKESPFSLDVLSIDYEELPVDLRYVASKLGVKTAVELLRYFQGTSIYVPRISKLTEYVQRYMRNNPDKSFKELAMELNVSENYIRKLSWEI